MMRFYPEAVPSFPHEPTRERFDIRPIGDNVGEGVVARVPFEVGDIVFGFTGFYSSEITLFSLQVEPGRYLHDPFFMGKILHRCDANCDVDMQRRIFTARKPIRPGDWVTMNYEQTEDRLYRAFNCVCGTEPCVGFEHGRLVQGRAVNRAEPGPEVKVRALPRRIPRG